MTTPAISTVFPFKKLSALAAAILLALSPAAPVWAQEEDAAPAAPAAADQRPQMGALFYTVEERRILEAIRQGVVEEEELEFTEDILPVVVVQETLPDENEQVIRERSKPMKVDAMIIRRKTGDASVWINEGGEILEFQVNPENDNRLGGKALPTRAGVLVNKEDISAGGVVGVDVFNNRRFRLQVGQILGTRGELDDSYPIVIRKRSGSGGQ